MSGRELQLPSNASPEEVEAYAKNLYKAYLAQQEHILAIEGFRTMMSHGDEETMGEMLASYRQPDREEILKTNIEGLKMILRAKDEKLQEKNEKLQEQENELNALKQQKPGLSSNQANSTGTASIHFNTYTASSPASQVMPYHPNTPFSIADRTIGALPAPAPTTQRADHHQHGRKQSGKQKPRNSKARDIIDRQGDALPPPPRYRAKCFRGGKCKGRNCPYVHPNQEEAYASTIPLLRKNANEA